MSQPETPEISPLVRLFYDVPERLCRYQPVTPEETPEPYRRLLAHDHHMTITVERFHHSPVDVQVLDTQLEDSHYARKILLKRQTDGQVVQFGLVRLDFAQVSPEVRAEIESRQIPLGRVLINHKVLRKIHLVRLWKIEPSEELCRWFGVSPPIVTYGRTAWIDCDGKPAVELLEIVAPVES